MSNTHVDDKVGLDDFFAAGGTVDQLLALATDTLITPEATRPRSTKPLVRTILDLNTTPVPRPIIGNYTYRAGLTMLQTEPGVGKTMVGLAESVHLMQQGHAVVYLDEEGGEELARERLHALGATHDLVDRLFFYFAFQSRPWDEQDRLALSDVFDDIEAAALAVGMLVLDSLPDFLMAAGRSEDSAQDTTWFFAEVMGVPRSRGIAQLVLDHLRKPESGKSKAERGRYARGSGAKLAKADAAILMEVATEFDPKTSGQLRLWKTKDRYGRLPLPRLSNPALLLDVKVNNGTVTVSRSAAAEAEAYDGDAKIKAEILRALAGAQSTDKGEMSSTALQGAIQHRGVDVRRVREVLVAENIVIKRLGSNRSEHYRLAKPGDGVQVGFDVSGMEPND